MEVTEKISHKLKEFVLIGARGHYDLSGAKKKAFYGYNEKTAKQIYKLCRETIRRSRRWDIRNLFCKQEKKFELCQLRKAKDLADP